MLSYYNVLNIPAVKQGLYNTFKENGVKKILVFTALIAAVLFLGSCNLIMGQDWVDSNKIVGTWGLQSDTTYHLVFNSDGTGSEGGTAFTWNITDGILHYIDSSSNDYPFTYEFVTDDHLVLTFSTSSSGFVRQ